MARIGYARVSSLDQDLDGQLARLAAEGCSIIRSEKVSGASREGRPELAPHDQLCDPNPFGWAEACVATTGLFVLKIILCRMRFKLPTDLRVC